MQGDADRQCQQCCQCVAAEADRGVDGEAQGLTAVSGGALDVGPLLETKAQG